MGPAARHRPGRGFAGSVPAPQAVSARLAGDPWLRGLSACRPFWAEKVGPQGGHTPLRVCDAISPFSHLGHQHHSAVRWKPLQPARQAQHAAGCGGGARSPPGAGRTGGRDAGTDVTGKWQFGVASAKCARKHLLLPIFLQRGCFAAVPQQMERMRSDAWPIARKVHVVPASNPEPLRSGRRSRLCHECPLSGAPPAGLGWGRPPVGIIRFLKW